MNEVILAVDGGATKTAVTVRKRDGTILFEGQGEGSNYQTTGADRVKEVLLDLLIGVKEVLPVIQVDIAVFALAGIDSERDESIVRGIVEEVCRLSGLQAGKLIVENDAQATLLGVTGFKPGALLISGTGSIAFAHDGKGNIFRSGGWGHRAGDEGSGYWMGREAMRAVFRMEDGRGPLTSLYVDVLEELSLTTIDDLAGWLYRPDYSVDRVARLSVIVDRCARQGDCVAVRILEEAATELALLVASILRRSRMEDGECVVYLNGGAVIHSERLRNGLEKRVGKEFPRCRIIHSIEPPIENIVKRGWGLKSND